MPILKIIFDICLLRGRPQDLPASRNLLGLIALAAVVTSYARVMRVDGASFSGLILSIFQVAIFGAVVWVVLKVRDRPERWLQSMTALYAVNTLFGLMILPVLPQLVEAAKHAIEAFQQGTAAPIGWELLFASAADVWYLLIMAQVLRQAAEWSFGLSVFVSVFALLSIGMMEIQLTAILSVPAPT